MNIYQTQKLVFYICNDRIPKTATPCSVIKYVLYILENWEDIYIGTSLDPSELYFNFIKLTHLKSLNI